LYHRSPRSLSSRYLAENKTPEWARAYMDYRACKKAIKAIAIRLAEAHLATDAPVIDSKAAEMVLDGELDDGSSDEDFGPVASPRDASVKSARNSLRNAKSPVLNERGRDKTLSPPGGIGGGMKRGGGLSPGYGSTSTTTSPRIVNGRPVVPPPLDLGEASYEADPPLTKRSGLGQGTIIPSPTHSEGSQGRTSDDLAETSDSARPLTSRPMSKINKASPKQVKSPRFANTIDAKGTASPRLPHLPPISRRKAREFAIPR
jgi:hypothetical protein